MQKSHHFVNNENTVRRIMCILFDVFKLNIRVEMLLLFYCLLSSCFPILQLWVMSKIINCVVFTLNNPKDPHSIGQLELFIGISSAIMFASLAISRHAECLEYKMSKLLDYSLHKESLSHCIQTDFETMENPSYQNMLCTLHSVTLPAILTIHSSFLSITRTMLMMLFSLAALYTFGPYYLSIIIGTLVPCFLLGYKLALKHNDYVKYLSTPQRRANYFFALITSHYSFREILMLGIGKHLLSQWDKLKAKHVLKIVNLKNQECMFEILVCLVRQILHGVLCFIIATRIIRSSGTVGSMVMHFGIIFNVQGYIQEISSHLINLCKNTYMMDEYRKNICIKPSIENVKQGNIIKDKITSIKFENVWFKYQNNNHYALKDVSFEVKENERACIVGKNGAGKSTVLNLILRLYDPQQGKILINGIDIKKFNIGSLRSKIAAYCQDSNRYYFSLRDNIMLGDIERISDREEILRLIKETSLEKVVSRMPMREETMLGQIFGGEDISSGEWQRLIMARTFYRHAVIYLLDEPTSALDAENEDLILSYFNKMLTGKISIIISHQLSTVRHADKIIVLNGGRIEDIGSHHELLINNGTYRKLFSLQKLKYSTND